MYGGVLEVDGESRDQEPVVTAHASGNGSVEGKEEERLAWGTNAVVLKSPWTKSPSIDDLLAEIASTRLH